MSTQKRQIIAPAQTNRRRARTIMYASFALLAIVVLVAIALYNNKAVSSTASQAPGLSELKVGDAAPSFAVSTTQGPFDLGKVSNQPVLLEVFATWCPHCQAEVKTMNALYAKFGKQASIVAVSGSPKGIDNETPESQLDVVSFQQKFGVQYPIAFDGTMDVANKYLQGGFPTLVVIDKTKKVSFISSGEVPVEQLTEAITKAL